MNYINYIKSFTLNGKNICKNHKFKVINSTLKQKIRKL